MITTCPPDCKDCLAGKVPCLECKPTRHFKALSGHIQVHVMSLDDYRKKYTQDGSGDDVNVGWTVTSAAGAIRHTQQVNAAITNGVKQYDPLAKAKDNFSDSEKDLFDNRYGVLFIQADEDPALGPTIRDIVMGEINIVRYQEQMSRITAKFAQGKSLRAEDASSLQALSKLVKDAQDTNLKLLDKLNLTREKKQAAKKVIESTPSRYVSAYERIQKNFTPEQFNRAKIEEKDAVMRLLRKREYFESLAQEPEKGV